MLDLSKYQKKIFTEEEAKKEVANMVAIWAIEGMAISEAKQQVIIDLLTGRITEAEYDKLYLQVD